MHLHWISLMHNVIQNREQMKKKLFLLNKKCKSFDKIKQRLLLSEALAVIVSL